MSLNVTIPDTFNGPLDLLLHLIRRDEMDIHDIPISRLTSAYLEEIRKLDTVNVDEAAEFLDLASRLLDIKSRMMLPPEETEEPGEEGEDDFDPRAGLVEALLEYRRFRDAARMLGDMAEEQARRYPRVAPRMEFAATQGDEAFGVADCTALMEAFQSLLLRMMPEDESNVITYTEVPTSVRIAQIEAVLQDVDGTRFSLLLSGTPDRREMVGFFIAMLELVRQGRIVVRQSATFSDIVIERRRPVVAKAGAAIICRRWGVTPRFLPVPAFRAAGGTRHAVRAVVGAFPAAAGRRTRPAAVGAVSPKPFPPMAPACGTMYKGNI